MGIELVEQSFELVDARRELVGSRAGRSFVLPHRSQPLASRLTD